MEQAPERQREVEIQVGEAHLGGTLTIPEGAPGLVLFVHGSGSSRFSSRNRFVARALQEAGLGTLLFDLLSSEEERIDLVTAELRFDIGLLTERVVAVTSWLRADEATRGLAIGYFGASTGAASPPWCREADVRIWPTRRCRRCRPRRC